MADLNSISEQIHDAEMGRRFQMLRHHRGYSAGIVAKRAAISATLLRAFEKGEEGLSMNTLRSVANVLGVSLSDIVPIDPHLGNEPTSWVRDVDRWFADRVSPHERQYLWVAKRIVRDEEGARDLVHDAYAAVLAEDAWRAIDNPRAYVMRVVFTLGLKKVRRAKVVRMQRLPDFETMDFAAQEPNAYEALAVRDQLRVAMSAINTLPDMTRRVIIMRRLDGLPIKVIAHRLGISVKGVDYHIARGALLFNRAVAEANLDGAGIDTAESGRGTGAGPSPKTSKSPSVRNTD